MMYKQIIRKQENKLESLSRDEEIFLILLIFLKDPYLTEYFMKVYQTCIFQDNMKFHISLRRNGKAISKLYNKKNKNISWSPAVPLSCDIPITVNQWRQFQKLKTDIQFFYDKFIGERINNFNLIYVSSIQKKIKIVNHVRKLIQFNFINEDFLNLSVKRHINGSNGSLDIDDYGGLIVDNNENSGYLIL